ncbi:MAG: hypothetical protein MJZ81_01175 [Bacteroidales bacterium]|nr:hypothetical protein [Bacteroidales bacterium]
MDGKAHGIITESSQRMRGSTIRTKAIEAAKVQAFFFWLLLYSRAISRSGVDTTATAEAKKCNRAEPKATTTKQRADKAIKSQTRVIPM